MLKDLSYPLLENANEYVIHGYTVSVSHHKLYSASACIAVCLSVCLSVFILLHASVRVTGSIHLGPNYTMAMHSYCNMLLPLNHEAFCSVCASISC